jgi:hypothetical protein
MSEANDPCPIINAGKPCTKERGHLDRGEPCKSAPDAAPDLVMSAWGLIANATSSLNGVRGTFTLDQLAVDESAAGDWAAAAVRWREAFHAEIDRRAKSNLVQHAITELALLGQTEEDPAFSAAIVEAVAAFSAYGHSGGSAGAGVEFLTKLLRFENLAPLTDSPDEWIDRAPETGRPMWQSKRNSKVFCDGPPWASTTAPYEVVDGKRVPYAQFVVGKRGRAQVLAEALHEVGVNAIVTASDNGLLVRIRDDFADRLRTLIAPAAEVDDGEVWVRPEGEGFRIGMATNADGDQVSHLLTEGEAASLTAALGRRLTPPDPEIAAEG